MLLPRRGRCNRRAAADGPPLAGTERLDLPGDITSLLVDGCDRFLLAKTEQSIAARRSSGIAIRLRPRNMRPRSSRTASD